MLARPMRPTPDQTTLEQLVAAASCAPSIHNTQPWRFVRTPAAVDLYADPARRLMATDPGGRELMASCGAALHTFQVVAAAAGWVTKVRRLPDPSRPHLVAEITFATAPASPEAVALAQAVPARRTDRRRVSSWPVPEGRLHQLVAVAATRGVLGAG